MTVGGITFFHRGGMSYGRTDESGGTRTDLCADNLPLRRSKGREQDPGHDSPEPGDDHGTRRRLTLAAESFTCYTGGIPSGVPPPFYENDPV